MMIDGVAHRVVRINLRQINMRAHGERVHAARVVFSGVAPVPWRPHKVEKVLTGRRLDADTIAAEFLTIAGALR